MFDQSIARYFSTCLLEPLECRSLNAASPAVSFTVNLSETEQTIRGIGANLALNPRNPNPLGQVVDSVGKKMMSTLDVNMIRVGINLKTWEPENDNNNANKTGKGRFRDGPGIAQNFKLMKQFQDQGATVVASIFDLPDWMVSNPDAETKRELKPGYEIELAESVATWISYGEQKYGLRINLLSINEGNSGFDARFNQQIFSGFIRVAGPYFQARGLEHARWLVGDDNIQTLTTQAQPMLNADDIRPYISALAVAHHSWNYLYRDDKQLAQWAAEAEKWGKEVWVTEFGTNALGYYSPEYKTWKHARDMAHATYRALDVAKASALLWWRFSADFPLINPKTYAPLPVYYVMKPLFDNLQPGTQMIGVDRAGSGKFEAIAAKNVENNRFFAEIINRNKPGSKMQTVTLTGLPNVPITVTRSSASENGALSGTYRPIRGRLTFNSPADSVTFLTGKLELNRAPSTRPKVTITSPAADFAFRRGGTVSFSARAIDAEDGKLGKSSFEWTLTPIREGVFGKPMTKSGVRSGVFDLPASPAPTSGHSYLLRVTVTDLSGLQSAQSMEFRPKLK